MSVADDLERLSRMRRAGSLSEAEYQAAKLRILSEPEDELDEPHGMTETEINNWAMLIHFSQFCGYLVPLAGLVVPIVLWQMKKNESSVLDEHGIVVANWLISWLIYAAISFVLVFLIIGIPMLIALGIVGLVFPIIGGLKASKGEVWSYPLSLSFLSPDSSRNY